mmetsp:Transcript_18462/g.56683  ORF Transcript_18462/g.56683 Transcript_18462/m.56683 type:complete len:199 (+) Transcript_18462:34-630(+)
MKFSPAWTLAAPPGRIRHSLTQMHALPPLPVPLPVATSEALLAIPIRDQLIIVIRICWAGLAGAVLGLERSRRRGRAQVGPRTMTLVSIGAALFTVAGVFGPGGDPTRLAASAASGVGFIGAGVISSGTGENASVDGLTTAASVWCAAALGVASGVGLGFTVTLGTAIAVTVLESSHIYRRIRRERLKRLKRKANPLD